MENPGKYNISLNRAIGNLKDSLFESGKDRKEILQIIARLEKMKFKI